MAQEQEQGDAITSHLGKVYTESSLKPRTITFVRPQINQALSDPTFMRSHRSSLERSSNQNYKVRFQDGLQSSDYSYHPNIGQSENRYSHSTFEESPSHSRSSSPERSPASTATSPSIYTPENFTSFTHRGRPRRSMFKRLKQSIGATAINGLVQNNPFVEPTDFSVPSERPEKRFVDSIGIVCPGVCDRPQCALTRAHFVSSFRLCQPIEYTTALAEHGITYSDYCRLIIALNNFLADNEAVTVKRGSKDSAFRSSTEHCAPTGSKASLTTISGARDTKFYDTTEQLSKTKWIAEKLNELLKNITLNLQGRELAVTICVSSFSLFAPHRVSEAHIQILHTPQHVAGRQDSMAPDPRLSQRLSFINPVTFVEPDFGEGSNRRHTPEKRSQADDAEPSSVSRHHRNRISHLRDRSRPWSLWPNAIPSTKRKTMDENADRYGTDPHFRAWMRANINSHTRSSSYAQYMIEQENDPFVNKRVVYLDSVPRRSLLWTTMRKGTKAWSEQFPSAINRAKYEQNRRLECRKMIEKGSRLRILRFGFRNPIYPPHNPEMSELGLSYPAYQKIMAKIDSFHFSAQMSIDGRASYSTPMWKKIKHRTTENALLKVGEYLRELNASQRRIVWTIERIPRVYDRGLTRSRTEWEISAWNGEDPLELLIQLERWGLIEKRLSIDEDE